jgi:hypothetical protein
VQNRRYSSVARRRGRNRLRRQQCGIGGKPRQALRRDRKGRTGLSRFEMPPRERGIGLRLNRPGCDGGLQHTDDFSLPPARVRASAQTARRFASSGATASTARKTSIASP